MDILILGGTMFLGRHLVEAALASGHRVTLFNRGRTNPGLFPDVERITGDRTTDLALLDGRRWDHVIDTSGYFPRAVRASAEALATSGSYAFVSSISAYADSDAPTLTEDSPVGTLDDPTVEEITGDTYGPLKALCEDAVREVFGDRALVSRPGLIVGPHDPSGRFTYWPMRVARGGTVLAPPRDTRAQIIDVRDLAAWHIRAAEGSVSGTFNATGPERPLTFEEMLEACKRGTGSDARFEWVPDEFLLEHEVGPWMELPLWIPAGEQPAFNNVDNSRAVATGMTFRPVEDIARDTFEWARENQPDGRPGAGLAPERENALLEAWTARPR